MTQLAKTHILFPIPLLRDIDRLVGAGRRSRFVIEATEEKLKRIHFLKTLDATSGAWSTTRHPKLRSQSGVNRFLKMVRRRASQRLHRARHG